MAYTLDPPMSGEYMHFMFEIVVHLQVDKASLEKLPYGNVAKKSFFSSMFFVFKPHRLDYDLTISKCLFQRPKNHYPSFDDRASFLF
jgi:hypothetical protein